MVDISDSAFDFTENVPKQAPPTTTLEVTKPAGPVATISDGTLAGRYAPPPPYFILSFNRRRLTAPLLLSRRSVLELAQTLTKNNAVLRERTEEKARLTKIASDFRKHLAWQAQRTQQLKRNLERLHNETTWLTTKGQEVKQDVQVIGHELRQANGELDKIKAARDARRFELSTVEQELKLEKDAAAAVGQLCSQANKALAAHSRERDGWKAEADRTAHEARKLKDRLEEMAYKVNGMSVV